MSRLEEITRPLGERRTSQVNVGMHRRVEIDELGAIVVTGRTQNQTATEVTPQRIDLGIVHQR